jgi:hypothetical protein
MLKMTLHLKLSVNYNNGLTIHNVKSLIHTYLIMSSLKRKKYEFLKFNDHSINNYSLLPLRYEDIFKIKKWRNDQIHILRQNKILSDLDQENFYQELTKKSFYNSNPNEILFSFLLNDVCIGYGGLVYVNWGKKSAEISFINETKRANQNQIYYNDFTTFLSLLFIISFSELKLDKLTTETYGIRTNTLEILDKLGFQLKKIEQEKILINNQKFDSFFHEYLNKFYTMV